MLTISRSGAPLIKPFTGSYSRLKNFEVCPKRHYEIDILRSIKEPQGEQLLWGDYVHKSLAARMPPKNVALPEDLKLYEPWADKFIGDGSGDFYVEQSMALTEEFKPTTNFAPDVWWRAKVDLLRVVGDIALLVDWKTGKLLDEPVQLALSAAMVFAKYPELKAIRCSYVWLKEDAETTENYTRDDVPAIWRNVWPRIEALKAAHTSQNYPPQPSGMCRAFCAVKACPHNGKSFR